ncbi:hypothetical protein GGR52DRAFT_374820 [Hypoxylon sp. FL1284]|nr:hypothetical protein GGR52DRAFT_374820 [Hypoxylon sp. FL1284]
MAIVLLYCFRASLLPPFLSASRRRKCWQEKDALWEETGAEPAGLPITASTSPPTRPGSKSDGPASSLTSHFLSQLEDPCASLVELLSPARHSGFGTELSQGPIILPRLTAYLTHSSSGLTIHTYVVRANPLLVDDVLRAPYPAQMNSIPFWDRLDRPALADIKCRMAALYVG